MCAVALEPLSQMGHPGSRLRGRKGVLFRAENLARGGAGPHKAPKAMRSVTPKVLFHHQDMAGEMAGWYPERSEWASEAANAAAGLQRLGPITIALFLLCFGPERAEMPLEKSNAITIPNLPLCYCTWPGACPPQRSLVHCPGS